MNQIQCAMIIFFIYNVIALAKKLRSYHNKKKEIKRTIRNYRTLRQYQIVVTKKIER